MPTMPSNITSLKNSLSQGGAWVWLLTFTLPGEGPVLRFCSNTENIVYDGQVYNAFNFSVGGLTWNSDGEIPEMNMVVTNVAYQIQEYVREYEGLIGSEVSFVQVNTDYLEEDWDDDLTTLTVVGAVSTWPDLTLTLSIPSALRYRVPEDRLNPHSCRHKFRSARCGYVGKAIAAITLSSGLPVSVDVAAIAAQGTLTLPVNPTGYDTMTIGTVTYRFRSTLSAANDIKIGASLAATQDSIVKTLNGTGSAGVDYYAGTTTPHPTVSAGNFSSNASVLTARTAGVAGNAIVTTEVFTAATNVFDARTLGQTRAGWEHGFIDNDIVRIETSGITGLNGDYVITLVDTDTFTLNGTDGADYTGSYSSGGKAGYAQCQRIPEDCLRREMFPSNYSGPLSMRTEGVRYA